MITAEMLRKQWPRAPRATIDGIMSVAAEVFETTGIDTPLRVAHFMAQITHECGAGTIVRENMNYSADRLMQIFGVGRHSAKITPDEAARLAHKPVDIAERVYGIGNPKKAKELGNTRPGDGYAYRGNGMLQLTGRASHRRVGQDTGFDLEGNPRLLEDPATSFRVAATEFVELRCLPAADADDVGLVTRRVNGGANGLAERKVWLRKWKTCLDGVDEPPKQPRGADPVPEKPLWKSKIAQGAAGTVVSSALGFAGNLAQTASETSDTIQDTADNVTKVVTVAKSMLGLPMWVWGTLAVAGCAAAVVLGLYTLWERRKKLIDQGV